MERFIYRPIQRHEAQFFTVFIAAFGVRSIIQNLIGSVAGRGMETVTTPLCRASRSWMAYSRADLGALDRRRDRDLHGAVVFPVRTHVGVAMRALSEIRTSCACTASIPGASRCAFAMGSAVVAPGAIFTAMTAGLNPAIGTHVMLLSLAATIVGGIGSVRGARRRDVARRRRTSPTGSSIRSGAKRSRSSCCSRSSSSVHRASSAPDGCAAAPACSPTS